jgi:tetratricopeptide (TPR) repeat protein
LLGHDHPLTLLCKNNLGSLYRAQKYEQAEPLLKQVLEQRKAALGADHVDTLQSYLDLALLYKKQGVYDRAEPLCREAAERASARLGPAHPRTQRYVRELADCYERQGRYADAEPLRRKLAEYWKREETGSSQQAADLTGLGQNLLRQSKYLDAERALRESLAIRGQKERDEWATFLTRSLLGEALLGRGDYPGAEPLLPEGYQGLKQRQAKLPADQKKHLTEALSGLIRLYDAWGKKDEAPR